MSSYFTYARNGSFKVKTNKQTVRNCALVDFVSFMIFFFILCSFQNKLFCIKLLRSLCTVVHVVLKSASKVTVQPKEQSFVLRHF